MRCREVFVRPSLVGKGVCDMRSSLEIELLSLVLREFDELGVGARHPHCIPHERSASQRSKRNARPSVGRPDTIQIAVVQPPSPAGHVERRRPQTDTKCTLDATRRRDGGEKAEPPVDASNHVFGGREHVDIGRFHRVHGDVEKERVSCFSQRASVGSSLVREPLFRRSSRTIGSRNSASSPDTPRRLWRASVWPKLPTWPVPCRESRAAPSRPSSAPPKQRTNFARPKTIHAASRAHARRIGRALLPAHPRSPGATANGNTKNQMLVASNHLAS